MTGVEMVGGWTPRPAALRFARGEGRYVADIQLPHMLHAAIVRSTEAHAAILSIDTAAAEAALGVEAIVLGKEILLATEPQPVVWDLPGQRRANTRALACGVVRYIGEPVAVIVAKTEEGARKAAALVAVRYDPKPVVSSIDEALVENAIRLYSEWPDNVVARAQWEAGAVDAAFSDADLVIDGVYISGRVAGLSMETRGVVVAPEPALGGLTVWTSTQAIHQVRAAVAGCLRLPEHHVRVVAPDLGGAFGTKSCPYGEETLIAYCARKLRRPVRWIEDRREAFAASAPGRDERVELSVAFAADGLILGLKARIILDKGAEPYAASIGSAWTGGMMLPGAYKVGNLRIEALGVVTNKTPTGAYRGYGTPEVNFAMERALDEAARRLAIDPAELRRRNFVGEAEMPYQAATGLLLDSGRYREMLELAQARFGYDAAVANAARARSEGRKVGIGLAFYVEPTNMGPSPLCGIVGIRAGGFDVSQVRMEPSGHVTVFTGQTPMGQGVEAALARICAEELALPVEDVAVVHGDTAACSYTGYSSGGSRGAGVAGSSVLLATRKVKQKLIALAAHLLSADAEALVLVQGGIQVGSDAGRRLPISVVAEAAYLGHRLPPGMEPSIDERIAFDPPSLAISYGVALVEVEVEVDTDAILLRRIVFGHDCGPQIRPDIVEGQVVGGIVQGIGAALYERLPYDASCRPLTVSLRDYEMPLMADVPEIELVHLETPSPFLPNGAKGVGESGVIPIPAAIANAVRDALGPGGAVERVNTLPLTV